MEAFRGEANLMRHPRSFPLKGELWSHLKSCDERRRRVAYGQTLYKVNEQLKATVRKSASTGALPPATLERCPRVESKQAAKDDGKTLKSRLHFGASVALQAPSTQELVTVKNSSASVDDGKMMACPIESVSSPDVTLFRIMSMNDPTSCKAVHFGDSVWLQIFGGNGEPSWRNGSVVGAKVHQASWLPTVPLATSRNTALLVRSKEETSNNNNTTKIMGMPIPIRATLPKGKEDAAWSFHEMRQRNQNALTLGRWRIMPASDELAAEAVERGGYVCNDDPIYLEQDFLYICRDQGSHLLSFHRISPRDQSGSGGYRVERRGIWQIKVADASTSLREMSKMEQRSEMLMEKARKILQRSDGNRHGKRKYCEDESLCSAGGATFSVGLREIPEMQRAAREESALRMHASKESSPHEYFAAKFPKVGPQIMHPQKHERDDGSVVTTKAAYSYGARVSRSRINRQNSEPLLPSFKQQRKDLFGRGSGGAAVDEASSTDSATHFLNLSTVSSAQIRKSRLLSNAASWPYALYKEDETVAQQRRCLQSRHDNVADPESSRLSPRRCRESRSCDEMLSSCSRITIDGSLMEKKSTTTTGSCGRFASVSQVGNDEARSMRRGGEHPIRQRLREADDFLKKDLEFAKRRRSFNELFSRLHLEPNPDEEVSWSPDAPAAAPVAAPAAAQPAPVAEEAESATKFESVTEEPLEDAALPLSELPVFVEEDSLACFQGDAGLLRHVSRSMLSVLQSKFIPGLKNAVENLLASSVFELLREVLVFLLSLTECVIAPRLRRSAIDAQKALSSSSSSQGDELQASDETFVTTAYTNIKDGDDAESILKNAIPDLVLLGATETLIENLDLFVVTLSRVE